MLSQATDALPQDKPTQTLIEKMEASLLGWKQGGKPKVSLLLPNSTPKALLGDSDPPSTGWLINSQASLEPQQCPSSRPPPLGRGSVGLGGSPRLSREGPLIH